MNVPDATAKKKEMVAKRWVLATCLERETGIEPATSSLGKRQKIVYQGFSGHRSVPKCTLFTRFPTNDREWSHKGVIEGYFNFFQMRQ